jgi:nitrate/nitrite transporter NarK
MWLFILEAIPTLILSFVLLRVLTDRPAEADWLPAEERDWLVRRMAAERQDTEHSPLSVLMNPRVLALALVCFGAVIINYGLSFFLPQIVKSFGLSNSMVGWVSALPFVAALFGILGNGFLSDATGNRRGCAAGAIILCGCCLAVSTLFDAPVAKMTAITAAGFFMFGYLPAFWAIPEQFLKGAALAAGIATINAIANIAGFVGPYLMGYLYQATGSYKVGLLVLATVGAALTLLLLGLRPAAVRVGEAVRVR